MQPYSVFQARVDGVTVPARSLRPLQGAWADWCASEGIEAAWVEQVDVTRFDDGSMVAYCTRREQMPPTELELVRTKHPTNPGLAVYPGHKSLTRTYITHHPVSSIQPLLDAAFPRQAEARAPV